MNRVILTVLLSMMIVSFAGCGGSSDDQGPLTIEDYTQKIVDVKAQLEKDIAVIEETFWGSAIEYYAFDLDSGEKVEFTNAGYGQTLEYSDPGVRVYDEDYEMIYEGDKYDYNIDEDDELTINITHDDTTSTYLFTPNTIGDLTPRVQGSYQYLDDNSAGSFTTTRDGREFSIDSLEAIASKLIISYEAMIDSLSYVPDTPDDTTDDTGTTTDGIKTCSNGTKYILNTYAESFAGTYHLFTNEQSTLVLNRSGTGSELVYKLNNTGAQTNEVDYDVQITSWGLLVDASGDLIKYNDTSYYFISETNDPTNTCNAHKATLADDGSTTLDYWF